MPSKCTQARNSRIQREGFCTSQRGHPLVQCKMLLQHFGCPRNSMCSLTRSCSQRVEGTCTSLARRSRFLRHEALRHQVGSIGLALACSRIRSCSPLDRWPHTRTGRPGSSRTPKSGPKRDQISIGNTEYSCIRRRGSTCTSRWDPRRDQCTSQTSGCRCRRHSLSLPLLFGEAIRGCPGLRRRNSQQLRRPGQAGTRVKSGSTWPEVHGDVTVSLTGLPQIKP